MRLLLFFNVLFIVNLSFCAFPNNYPKISLVASLKDPPRKLNSEPLILTPLIERNEISKAQKVSEIHLIEDFKSVKCYSGYFTVDKQHNSNLFFWFFPSQKNFDKDPLILWLQGGPGATSMIGLFFENGPFQPYINTITNKTEIKLRKQSWTKTHSVLYIDNPVGCGYSFTTDGYRQSQNEIAQDLYNALQQFFLLFPNLQNNDFFISGESYAGKYVPSLAYIIYKKNPEAKLKINLKGMTIGNGFTDPLNQLNYDEYLYQLGLIDNKGKNKLRDLQQKGINYIKNGNYIKAFLHFNYLINGGTKQHSSLFENITGFRNYYNYLIPNQPDTTTMENMMNFIQQDYVRDAIHVGNVNFHIQSTAVEINLISDIMRSVAPWVSELLNHFRILIYNGQLDIIVAYPLTINYLQNLNFSSANDYKIARRYIWKVNNDIAGYVKQAGNLTEVLVRNAGHMVPMDQPDWTNDLIYKFLRNKSLQ